MLNKLREFSRQQDLIRPGDKIVCAVSGGADSMALLWALFLLKEEWDLDISAAHFNHRLRGAESDRDEAFVREFCAGYKIPLHVGSGTIIPGKKGLEAAARDARYAFLRTLSGKIATAHTADDNAETLLMHLVRGTGLKGLGGIMPQNGNVIRPMLSITRREIEDFLAEYAVDHITDSSNDGDDFLRNRIRHHVMPLLKEENPKLSQNLSAMALRLRLDEEALTQQAAFEGAPQVEVLRKMAPAVRARALEKFLKDSGVKEPEAVHIRQADALVFSDNPSARANFPGGLIIGRRYDILAVVSAETGSIPYEFSCDAADSIINTADTFTVLPVGDVYIRSRQAGDSIRLSGGTKTLKKLFIDRKIPAAQRDCVPVICDDLGILAVGGIGVNLDRAAKDLPAARIRLIPVK